MHLVNTDAKKKNNCEHIKAVAPPPHEQPYSLHTLLRIIGQTNANEICNMTPLISINLLPKGKGHKHCLKKPKKVRIQPKIKPIILQALPMLSIQSSASVSPLFQPTQPLVSPEMSTRHGPIDPIFRPSSSTFIRHKNGCKK
jgi:hypothetical protein